MSQPSDRLLNWTDVGGAKFLSVFQTGDSDPITEARRKALSIQRSPEFMRYVNEQGGTWRSTDFLIVPAVNSVNGAPRVTVQIKKYFVSLFEPFKSRPFNQDSVESDQIKYHGIEQVAAKAREILSQGPEFPEDEFSTKLMQEFSHPETGLRRIPWQDTVRVGRYPGNVSMIEPTEDEVERVRKEEEEEDKENEEKKEKAMVTRGNTMTKLAEPLSDWILTGDVMTYIEEQKLKSAAIVFSARGNETPTVDRVGLVSPDDETGTLVLLTLGFSWINPRDGAEDSTQTALAPKSENVEDTPSSLTQ
ncbi:hypothetical protein TREMEDRAFT_59100 [Tremella mesenterica DSM 1558]|uniref:uncharacterized protein n=1 Tax=Tremella mesenterica (strain ATCC 24925 / CBS 8224 / DSM 1558 / NBRC 9311 / NRRL Y-6157 / RJB 2259-6 / UBC 559-6) TaxID=578456 RepID=UPI0003F496BC|nr:uncharacterized protein TREMEDRAFT_59100 [Tremella mesenterica DSM 1558]EIW72940.1 hypothetical protein TREMEDRAFT_59100 [Tremella mesenterica DSM 1558]